MVRGLDLFRDYFKDYTDKYILIGGTACDLAMASMGLNFRATKDLDIILILEALDVEFVNAFWAFIKEGRYKNRQKKYRQEAVLSFLRPRGGSLSLYDRIVFSKTRCIRIALRESFNPRFTWTRRFPAYRLF